MRIQRGHPRLKGRLIDKSIEAYILALETINCLSIKYRVETFTYLVCNAWELLLKAKLLDDTRDRKCIYYRDVPKRTLALRDCVARVYLNENDAVRRNIEMVADLRDEACHLIITKVPKNVLCLFQACVLNYHKALNLWFKKSLSERVSVGMMTIVYDFEPRDFDMNNPRLRRDMGKETADYLLRLQADIDSLYTDLGKPAEFSINIDFKLALIQKPGEADVLLSKGEKGKPTHIVEVPKDAARTHPYRQGDLVDNTNILLGGIATINAHDIQCVVRWHEIKKRPEFFYKSSIPGSPSQYSHEFAVWMVQQFHNSNDFFVQARKKGRITNATKSSCGK